MEKIVVAIVAGNIRKPVIDFACYLARLTHSRLTGIVLDHTETPELPEQKLLFALPYVETVIQEDLPGVDIRKKQALETSEEFSSICSNNGVNCTVHQRRGNAVKELCKEALYADLLVVDPEMQLGEEIESTPSLFIEELLSNAACPVVLAPQSFSGVDELLFTYDGSASSVYSIKQFSYLFPELSDTKVIVLQVDNDEQQPLTDRQQIAELLKTHYSSIGFSQVQGKVGYSLFGQLVGKKNSFVIMGAYGRSMLSRLFRKSTADLLIRTLNLPIFITHR